MKNPAIAFLLGLLPLLQAGSGFLSIWGPEDYSKIAGTLLFFALGFFGWGWGYVYLSHTLRAIAAFFTGSLVNLSVLFVLFGEIGHIDAEYPVYKWWYNFAFVFYTAVFVVVAIAGMVLAVDAARLTIQHNRMVWKKQP